MKSWGIKQAKRGHAFIRWAVFLLVVGLGFLLAPRFALAASSGPNSGGTFENDTTVGTVSWGTTVSSAGASDNAYARATVTASGVTNYLKATNFSFAIPSGATIDGILVEFEKKFNFAGADTQRRDNHVLLLKGGVISGDNKGVTTIDWPTSDTYVSYGGATDTWGLSWTADDINASNFGVVISAQELSGTGQFRANVDHIRITVYYTEASTGGGSDGIDRRYARAVFWGYAFPRATLFMHEKGVPIVKHILTQSDGRFEIKMEESDERSADLIFVFVDQEGRSTPPRPISVRLDSVQPPRVDISPPPTLGFQQATITRGETLVLTGYASPRASINVMIDGKVVDTVTAGTDGKYSSVLNTATRNITIGSHIASVKQRFALTVGESGVSATKQFFVSAFGAVRGDFNGDGAVDIKDWSILVAKRKDSAMLTKLDLSGDGKINVVDLSIFLTLFRAGR